MKNLKKKFDKTQNNDLFISPTAASDYTERFRDMYTFSDLISNIRKVGKIDSRKMQGQSVFRTIFETINHLLYLKVHGCFASCPFFGPCLWPFWALQSWKFHHQVAWERHCVYWNQSWHKKRSRSVGINKQTNKQNKRNKTTTQKH